MEHLLIHLVSLIRVLLISFFHLCDHQINHPIDVFNGLMPSDGIPETISVLNQFKVISGAVLRYSVEVIVGSYVEHFCVWEFQHLTDSLHIHLHIE